MRTYFITRFSILDTKSDSWVISRENKDLEKLKEILFSDHRLSEKIWTFKNLTYESIKSQTNDNYMWLIYTSNQLPEKFKSELYSIENEKIKIVEVESQSEFFKKIKDYNYEEEYATVRLDDDDALSPIFIEKINNIYSINKSHKIVSFPNGIKIHRKENNLYSENKPFHYKKIGLGLTMFNGNIYLSGNHVLVDENNDILYDETPDMYLIFASENCDTKRKFDSNNCSLFYLDKYLKNKSKNND